MKKKLWSVWLKILCSMIDIKINHFENGNNNKLVWVPSCTRFKRKPVFVIWIWIIKWNWMVQLVTNLKFMWWNPLCTTLNFNYYVTFLLCLCNYIDQEKLLFVIYWKIFFQLISRCSFSLAVPIMETQIMLFTYQMANYILCIFIHILVFQGYPRLTV